MPRTPQVRRGSGGSLRVSGTLRAWSRSRQNGFLRPTHHRLRKPFSHFFQKNRYDILIIKRLAEAQTIPCLSFEIDEWMSAVRQSLPEHQVVKPACQNFKTRLPLKFRRTTTLTFAL